jgi:hypothetical protein
MLATWVFYPLAKEGCATLKLNLRCNAAHTRTSKSSSSINRSHRYGDRGLVGLHDSDDIGREVGCRLGGAPIACQEILRVMHHRTHRGAAPKAHSWVAKKGRQVQAMDLWGLIFGYVI